MSNGVKVFEIDRALAPQASFYFRIKPGIDAILAAGLLLLTLPVMAVLALLIKLDSPGPALFRQTRIGKDGKPFRFYKFRTMYVDARDRFPELYRYCYDDEEIRTLKFKLIEDPRLTRFGRKVRKASIDELPNFINVIKGDMSLVGPRPEIPEMLPYYRGDQKLKFSVRPGITGYAQVRGRGLLTFRETIQHDLEYVKERSAWTDLRILLRTIFVTVGQIGAF